MSRELHFRINTPTVTHETIEGECVAINLQTGHYYSLQGTAVDIWNLIALHTLSTGSIVDELCRRFEGSRDDIEEAATKFVQTLEAEHLIVEEIHPANSSAALATEVADPRPRFQLPKFQKFTDMEELLLLDPIHEVDEAGWPSARIDLK